MLKRNDKNRLEKLIVSYNSLVDSITKIIEVLEYNEFRIHELEQYTESLERQIKKLQKETVKVKVANAE